MMTISKSRSMSASCAASNHLSQTLARSGLCDGVFIDWWVMYHSWAWMRLVRGRGLCELAAPYWVFVGRTHFPYVASNWGSLHNLLLSPSLSDYFWMAGLRTLMSFSGFAPSNVSPLGSPCPSPPVLGTPVSSPTTKTCPVQLPEPAVPPSECPPTSAAPKRHHRALTHSQSAPSATTSYWRPPSLCGRLGGHPALAFW